MDICYNLIILIIKMHKSEWKQIASFKKRGRKKHTIVLVEFKPHRKGKSSTSRTERLNYLQGTEEALQQADVADTIFKWTVSGRKMLPSSYLITYFIKHNHKWVLERIPASLTPSRRWSRRPSRPRRFGSRSKRRTTPLRGDECSAARGVSCRASVAADE